MLLVLATSILATTYPKLGIALNVPAGGGADAYISAMRQQIRLGLDGNTISLKWDEFVTQGPKPLTDGMSGATFMDQRVLLTIGTLDTVQKRLPADLMNSSWDSEAIESRFDQFLTKIAPIVKDRTSWLSLGNEVNVYLAIHPEEQKPYLKFLAHARDTAHHLLPGVPVGVTVTCMDGLKAPALVTQLQDGMDATIFTYYPLDGMQLVKPLQTASHFAFMSRIAGDRPLLLQEIGCPTSPLNGSSEEIQAEFVKDVFKQMDAHAAQIQIGVYFIQTDLPQAMVDQMNTYYGISMPSFTSYLATLGLHDQTGKPRPAWKAFADACLQRKPIAQ